MLDVCPGCGEYILDWQIDLSGPYALCPLCHYVYPFLQQPLFIITGASGVGKTTICRALLPLLKECVVLEADILWGMFPVSAEDSDREYHNTWLRVCKNIGQSGRPVVLCGTALPTQLETSRERRYFSTLHYLALFCDNASLEARLRQRPPWRKSGSSDVIERMLGFNGWLQANAATTNPPMTLYDTGQRSVSESAEDIRQWIYKRLV